jgi:hypothetical protein
MLYRGQNVIEVLKAILACVKERFRSLIPHWLPHDWIPHANMLNWRAVRLAIILIEAKNQTNTDNYHAVPVCQCTGASKSAPTAGFHDDDGINGEGAMLDKLNRLIAHSTLLASIVTGWYWDRQR